MNDDEKIELLIENGYDDENAERLVNSLNEYGNEYGFPEDEYDVSDFLAGFKNWEAWQ